MGLRDSLRARSRYIGPLVARAHEFGFELRIQRLATRLCETMRINGQVGRKVVFVSGANRVQKLMRDNYVVPSRVSSARKTMSDNNQTFLQAG
jgi:hypothetical protein